MKVNARSREILFKELPWMEKVLPLDAVEFNVKLVDLNTLSLVPRGVTPTWSGAQWIQWGKIFFVGADGEGLGHVGEVLKTTHHRKWIWNPMGFIDVKEEKSVQVKETVEEALRRLSPTSKKARYIVEFDRHDESVVTIYKVPKRIPDLETWLEDRSAIETKNLQDTLAEV